MSDPEEEREQPAIPAAGIPLGGLAAGAYDTTPGGVRPADAAPPGDLTLPGSALVAFRKSGGLRFSSRGIVVYRNGWVVPLAGTEGPRRHLRPGARRALVGLILRSGLTRVPARSGGATRDGYSYEIVARVGGTLRSVELSDPVPAAQARLVQVLTRLLPSHPG